MDPATYHNPHSRVGRLRSHKSGSCISGRGQRIPLSLLNWRSDRGKIHHAPRDSAPPIPRVTGWRDGHGGVEGVPFPRRGQSLDQSARTPCRYFVELGALWSARSVPHQYKAGENRCELVSYNKVRWRTKQGNRGECGACEPVATSQSFSGTLSGVAVMSLEEQKDGAHEGLAPGSASEYNNAHKKSKNSPDRQSPCFRKADVLPRAQTCQTLARIRSGALPWLPSHSTVLINHLF